MQPVQGCKHCVLFEPRVAKAEPWAELVNAFSVLQKIIDFRASACLLSLRHF